MFNFTVIKQQKIWKLFLVSVGANLLVAGIYYYLFTTIEQKNQKSSELQSTIDRLNDEKDNLRSVKKNISETSILRDKVDNYLVSKDGVVEFLNLLNSLGSENDLVSKVVSVGIEPSHVSPDTLEVVRVNVEVYGTWANVHHFAALLELLPLKSSVSRFNLEKFSDGINQSSASPKNVSTALRPWKGTFDLTVLKLK